MKGWRMQRGALGLAFGERLVIAREGNGLTQRELAKRLKIEGMEVSPSHIAAVERLRVVPSPTQMGVLAFLLSAPDLAEETPLDRVSRLWRDGARAKSMAKDMGDVKPDQADRAIWGLRTLYGECLFPRRQAAGPSTDWMDVAARQMREGA